MKNIHILCKGRRNVIEDDEHFVTFEWNLTLVNAAHNIIEVSLHEKQDEPEYLRGRVESVLLNVHTHRVVFHCRKLPNRPDVVGRWAQWVAYSDSDLEQDLYDGQET